MHIPENHVVSFFGLFVYVALVLLFELRLDISVNSGPPHFILCWSSERWCSLGDWHACVVHAYNLV